MDRAVRRIHIQVPATIANLGAGFDSLALAVNLHNELTAEIAESGLEIEIHGQGEGSLPLDAENLIVRAAYKLFRILGKQAPGLRLRCDNRVPLGSGLGSSAGAVAAGMLLADAVSEARLTTDQLLRHAAEFEGHADNAAASLMGGLVIVADGPSGPITRQVAVAELQLLVVVPDLELPTVQMRNALPHNVPLEDAAFNIGRAALTVEALRTGDFRLMREAIADRIHQPYRARFIPGWQAARSAARAAGAAATALAGAGPGLIAFAEHDHDAIAEAIVAAFRSEGVSSSPYLLRPDTIGAQVNLRDHSGH